MTKGTGNPQLEDGYTQIANETLEELARFHLAPNAWRILMLIIRKTYGYHKKVDYIANCQIVQGTGLCKAVVSRCLRTLLQQNLITRNSKKTGLQDDYTLWQKAALSTSESHPGVKVSNTANHKKLAKSSTELAVSSTKVSNCAVTQKKKEKIQNKYLGELSPLLEILKTTEGYPYDEGKDIHFLKELKEDFPTVSLFHSCKDFRAYHLEKAIKLGDHPRSQLRNFCKTAAKQAETPTTLKPYQQAEQVKTKSEATKMIEQMQK